MTHHHYAVINHVGLHYVEAGAGPLVILLHGFPEFWYSWRHQIPALAAAGFRVFAPDLRGYNESGKPKGTRAYDLEKLTADVAGLIRHAGESRATVVGHDWGGGIAWTVPMHYPEMVESLIVLNAPHPAAFRREIRKPAQFWKSSYMLYFQLRGIPERALRAGNFAAIAKILRAEPVRQGAFTPEDIRLYREALAKPGALSAALNYYRALPGYAVRVWRQSFPPITIRTLLIWGERDRYLGLPLTEGLTEWVPNLRIERIADASHWVQMDAPDRVNDLMIQFLRNK
jgi:pimeloyl-ACP methyl ester carboxylesterase